jgi:glycosyltransferase involved in cell wall biosynthesis
MGYLCKYLRKAGWETVVLAEHIPDETFSFLAGNCPVYRINYYTAEKTFFARLQWLAVFILDILLGYKDCRMYREACRLIRRHGSELLLCSTFRDFPLTAARRAARRYRLPLVADIRDVIEQYAGNEYISHAAPLGLDRLLAPAFRRISLDRRNKALRRACCVTTVSPWHAGLLRAYNPSVELIYNGYDPEVFFPEKIPAPQFIITYTGRLFSTAMRDPALLFEALRILSREGSISPQSCRVRWYVDDASKALLAGEAEKNGVGEYMDFMGYVPASEIPSVLNSSSVLLLLANKASATGPKGIMTTKLFESFAVEKPILCIRSDESYLAELLAASQAGLAVREAGEACDFLRRYYAEWKENGYTSAPVNREITKDFSRRKQAEQFMHIFRHAEPAAPSRTASPLRSSQ